MSLVHEAVEMTADGRPQEHLTKFGLSLQEDKTRRIEFGQLRALARQQRRERHPKPLPSSAPSVPSEGPVEGSNAEGRFSTLLGHSAFALGMALPAPKRPFRRGNTGWAVSGTS
jgi:hypothetical protein